MENKEFTKKLEYRTRQFGITIIQESKELLAIFTTISNKL